MNDELRQRLAAVYSSGLLSEPDKAKFQHERANSLWRQSSDGLRRLGARCERVGVSWGRKISSLIITDLNAPGYIDWLSTSKPSRIEWLAKHNNVYAVMWLNVSAVWPAFEHYFNLCRPRGTTGYLDYDFSKTYEQGPWLSIVAAARQAAIVAGFAALTEAEGFEIVPFVMEPEWSDHDDDDEPTLEAANVSQCLFQDY